MTMKRFLLILFLTLCAVSTQGQTYRALLTQTDANDPSVTVLENTFDNPIVWVRTVEGVYTGTLNGAFVDGRTWLYIDPSNLGSTNAGLQVGLKILSVNTVRIFTGQGPDDNILNNQSIEIRVYPES